MTSPKNLPQNVPPKMFLSPKCSRNIPRKTHSLLEELTNRVVWEAKALTGKDEDEIKRAFVKHLCVPKPNPELDNAVSALAARYKAGGANAGL